MYLKKKKTVQARRLNFNNQKCHLKGFQSLKKVHWKGKRYEEIKSKFAAQGPKKLINFPSGP